MSDPWFVRRQIGVGWRPASWQGWLVTFVAVAGLVTALAVFRRTPAGIGSAVGIAAAYIAVALLTGGARAIGVPRLAGDGEAPVATRPPAPAPAPAPQTAAARLRTLRESPEPAGPPALVVDHLTKRFGERVAVADVSFTVAYGEVFGFLGPNGAGKTTTVRTLGTLIAPTSGSATVAGIPLEPKHGVDIRRRISIMPESPGLYLRLTVAENLQFFAGLYGIRDARARIGDALEAVNLAARAQDSCGSLSKGLRQRVGLARALLNEPAVLFLDEPTSGLDPVAAREVHELIDGLRRRGVTVFLTTHRLDEAERLCDRVAILNTTLRTVGRPADLRDELFSKSLDVRTAAPLQAPDAVFRDVPGVESWTQDGPGTYVVTVSDTRAAAPSLTRALVGAGADVLSITEARHSLEDVYLELIDDDVEARVS